MEVFSTEPAKLDLVGVIGDDFKMNVDFGMDLTGYDVNAKIKTDPETDFTINWIDQAHGYFSISLTKTQTESFVEEIHYCWELTWTAADTTFHTIITGMFKVVKSC
jgi:hypothetical protein